MFNIIGSNSLNKICIEDVNYPFQIRRERAWYVVGKLIPNKTVSESAYVSSTGKIYAMIGQTFEEIGLLNESKLFILEFFESVDDVIPPHTFQAFLKGKIGKSSVAEFEVCAVHEGRILLVMLNPYRLAL